MEALVKEVCDYIHNYFVLDTVESDFVIKNKIQER